MGRVFVEHLDGDVLYHCASCRANFSNEVNLLFTGIRGNTGPAVVFKNVVNIMYSKPKKCRLQTGHYFTRDAKCRKCKAALGWRYEFACDIGNRYKEGLTVIETNAIVKLNMRGELHQ